MNPAIGTENEKGGKTAKEDIGRIGGGIGVALCRRKEIARKGIGGDMNRKLIDPSTDGEAVMTRSAIIRNNIDHIPAREVARHEANKDMIPGAVGGATDVRRIILDPPRALDPDLLNLRVANTRMIMLDEMAIAAPANIDLLIDPANSGENYPRQQAGPNRQNTTRIRWRT